MLLRLDFRGFKPSTHARELVESNIRKIEARDGRIASCSVVVRAPGAHHRLGEHYSVSIRLGLPNGREVTVGSSDTDHRHAEIAFAINDSFRKAVRQLRDETRRLQGSVKQHGKSTKGNAP